jgi:hypothetical protein
VAFSLSGKKPSLLMETDDGRVSIAIGGGTYLKGDPDGSLPFCSHLKGGIAASGDWVNPSEFKLRVYFYETPARITYNFNFEEKELTWESKLEQSIFGPRKIEAMHGKLQ